MKNFKHNFALAAAVIGVSASMWAADPDELRIYINPGHGSWTGNDRPIQTIGKPAYSSTNTDTTGFFESNTNLIKGFGMLETLIKMGMPFDRTLNQEGERWEIGAAKDLEQNIVMSRVKNGPFEASNTTSSPNYMLYNRSLPGIAAEVEYNDFDMFVSIHSNAANTVGSNTNYHLFMYRGKNGRENCALPESWPMSEAAAKYSFANKHASWSESKVYINGDVDFMGSGSGSTNSLGYYGYLGVMKHGVPGYLVEGYFHTYLPATHRGMNFDVDFEEGAAYARGVAEYFGFERDKTGDLYGIVRDVHEKFTHAFYKPQSASDDRFLPLNGVKVFLHKDGQLVNTYTTDQNYNGAFVFTGLEPGTYSVTFEHPDYKDAEPVEVEVVAGDCVYPTAWLENKNWVSDADSQATYPDQLDPSTAFGATDKYTFKEVYTNAGIDALQGKKVRRTVVRGSYMYILAFDDDNKPTIVFYDLDSKKATEVSSAGMTGSIYDCADIQVTADGILVASAQTKLHYSDEQIQEGDAGRGELNFYRWKNNPDGVPEGDPIAFISTQNSSLWYRTYGGGTFAFEGTIDDGTITMSNPSVTGPTYSIRVLEISVLDGKSAGETVHKPKNLANAYLTSEDLGAYRFIPSPNNRRDVWILSEKAGIIEFSNNSGSADTPCNAVSAAPIPANVLAASAVKYAGASYLIVPRKDGELTVGIDMYDVTDGISNARKLVVENADISKAASARLKAPAIAAGEGAAAWVHVVRDNETNLVSSAHITLNHVGANGVSRFTTEATDQPAIRPAYAHSLAKSLVDGTYTLTFDVSAAAENAEIVITPVDGGDNIVVPVGAVKPGLNSATVNQSDLGQGTYNWTVNVRNAEVSYAGRFFATPDKTIQANSRGGVTWINDTESANFGKLVVANGYAQGIDVLNPALETLVEKALPEGNTWAPKKLNSPYRVATLNGIAVIADQSEAGAGYWRFDPSSPESVTDILAGERDAKGAHIFNGNSIGGSAWSLAFQGSGENTKMYTFGDDYPTPNAGSKLLRYAVGNKSVWDFGPEKVYDNVAKANLMSGEVVELVALPDGVFVAQLKTANVDEKSPAIIYVDNDGNVLFNSVTTDIKLKSCGSSIAVSPDMSTVAISEVSTGIGIYDLKWDGKTPLLTKRYIIPGSTGDKEVCQMVFDNAGALYAFHRGNAGLRAYYLRQPAKDVATPAPGALTLSADEAGVTDITVDNSDAPVVYYNLNGVRMSDDNLAPGIYIRRQGTATSKVIIR